MKQFIFEKIVIVKAPATVKMATVAGAFWFEFFSKI
jgi:hypothetical protein